MKLQIRRNLVQLAASVLYNINGAAIPLNGKGVNFDINTACVPGLNCQYCRYSIAGCPLGVAQLAAAGKLSNIAATFYGLLLLFALLFGRMICGWGCPMGLLQDLLDKAPFPKIKKNKITHALSYLKYIILAVFVIAIPVYTGLGGKQGINAFCMMICPGNFLEAAFLPNLLRWDVDNLLIAMNNTKFYWVMGLLLASMFIYRPFCRFICPLGAFYGFFNRVSVFGIRVDENKCIHCNACMRICKMDTKKVGDANCISCGLCKNICPKKAIFYKHCNSVKENVERK